VPKSRAHRPRICSPLTDDNAPSCPFGPNDYQLQGANTSTNCRIVRDQLGTPGIWNPPADPGRLGSVVLVSRWASGERALCDGKIEVGARIGFILQGVVPPLAFERLESAGLHDRTEGSTVPSLDRCDSLGAMM